MHNRQKGKSLDSHVRQGVAVTKLSDRQIDLAGQPQSLATGQAVKADPAGVEFKCPQCLDGKVTSVKALDVASNLARG